MNKFENEYRIPSARASCYDYGGGAYFVTVCTPEMKHYFGKIIFGGMTQMRLSPVGQYLSDNLQNIQDHYPYADIPLFMVMPNHIHAIVFIDADGYENTNDTNDTNVKTMYTSSLP
ncbi:MAG: hypothetical protein QM654_00915 [Dysgonamonadaceae bacterium]